MKPHDVIVKSSTLEEIATSTHRSHTLMRFEDCKKQEGREERYTQSRQSTTSTRRYVLRAGRSPWHRTSEGKGKRVPDARWERPLSEVDMSEPAEA